MNVFVYGSLRNGYWNHWLLQGHDVTYICMGRTSKKFALYSLIYPWLTRGRPNDPLTNIIGELYDVGPKTFAQLDILEGYPDHYDREILEIETDDGTIVSAWVYILKDIEKLPSIAHLISSGDYAEL